MLARLPDAPEGVKGISLSSSEVLVNADGSLGARNDAQCVSIEHKLGIHGSPTCVMQFGDAGGATGYVVVGEVNRGLEYMFVMMNLRPLGVGLQGIGIAERAYQRAVAFARERVQSRDVGAPKNLSVPIIRHPTSAACCCACARNRSRARWRLPPVTPSISPRPTLMPSAQSQQGVC